VKRPGGATAPPVTKKGGAAGATNDVIPDLMPVVKSSEMYGRPGSSSFQCNGGIQTPDSSPQGSPEPYSKLDPPAAVGGHHNHHAQQHHHHQQHHSSKSSTGNCLGSLPTPEMSPMEQEDLQLEAEHQRHLQSGGSGGAFFQLEHKFSSASAFLRSVSHPYRPTMMSNNTSAIHHQQQGGYQHHNVHQSHQESSNNQHYPSTAAQFFSQGNYYNPPPQQSYNEYCEYNNGDNGKYDIAILYLYFSESA